MSVRVEEEVAECVFVCVCVCSTHFDFFNSKANCWITVIYIFITVKNLLIVPILKLHSWGEKHNFPCLLRSFRTSGPLSSPDTTLKPRAASWLINPIINEETDVSSSLDWLQSARPVLHLHDCTPAWSCLFTSTQMRVSRGRSASSLDINLTRAETDLVNRCIVCDR